MYQFQREELTSLDEASVVGVYEAQGEEGEYPGEEEVHGKVGVGVADDLVPVALAGCGWVGGCGIWTCGVGYEGEANGAVPTVVGLVADTDVVLR